MLVNRLRMFLLGTMLLFSAKYSMANQLVVTVNPRDCISCQAALSDTSQLMACFQTITIAFPARFKQDSQVILQKSPLLQWKHFQIIWEDRPMGLPHQESVSTAYYMDNAGNVLKRLPLKLFSPQDMIGYSAQRSNSILFEDTIQTKNRVPTSISHFVIAGQRFYLTDDLNNEIIYLDMDSDEKLYRSVRTEAFTKSSYKLVYGDASDAALARNEGVLKREQAGPIYKIVGVSNSGDTVFIAFKYQFIHGPLLRHFDVVFGICGNRIVQHFLIVNPNSDYAEKAIDEMARREHLTDSTPLTPSLFRVVVKQLDSQMKHHTEMTPLNYAPSTYDIFKLSDSEYALPARMNSKSYQFIGLYQVKGEMLVPEGKMLRIEKGSIYQKSENYSHFQNLCGNFPFLMHRISNVLYDIRNDTSCILPLSLGSYDIGPAAMAKLEPKIELYIYDVMVDKNVVNVLYENGMQLCRLCYDLTNQRILIDGPLLKRSGAPILVRDPGFHIKFKDPHSFFIADEVDQKLTRIFLN